MGVGVTILSSPPLPFNCCGNREIAAFLKKKKECLIQTQPKRLDTVKENIKIKGEKRG